MSTWLDDLKKTNPKLAAEYAIVGDHLTRRKKTHELQLQNVS